MGIQPDDTLASRSTQTTRVLLRSFGYAAAGVGYVLRTQRNARIEAVAAAGAVAVGIWLGLGAIEWAVLALTITIVLGLEVLNTSLEIAVSLAAPKPDPLAKAAKDVAAAAVLVGALGSLAVGLFLFGPRLVARFFAP